MLSYGVPAKIFLLVDTPRCVYLYVMKVKVRQHLEWRVGSL